MKGGCAVMCGRFFVFYCFLFITGRIGVFPVVRKTRQLEQEKGAVENEKVVVHKKIKYSIKS
jgi:hypothetical protein